jgi:hypothetical protein
MKVDHGGVTYETTYYPFFCIEQHDDFDVYTVKYPSGFVEEILVFDTNTPQYELESHLQFLLREYALENDELLTPKAMELKQDVRRLFGIQ